MSFSAKKALLKVPGEPKDKKGPKAEALLKLDKVNVIINKLTSQECAVLCKSKEKLQIDLSSPMFQLENTLFLREISEETLE